MPDTTIRLAQSDDRAQILALYPLAFPDEMLTDLVGDLLSHVDVLSLVAIRENTPIAHAAFTPCSSTTGDARLALLGPIGVHPDHQRDGLGKALIEAGAAHLQDSGVSEMLVLGDPDYYRNRGFDAPASIAPPYPLRPEWSEAWRSRLLSDAKRATGRLTVPQPWQAPKLWA
jgi:putative acetyltransferase